jgi:hypothetical protein
VEEGELPKSNCVDYLVRPAPSVATGSGTSAPNTVFVLDISGSMCVTMEVEGRIRFKGTEEREARRREETTGHDVSGVQRLPHEKHNVTHVSRLQCLQAAVESQIKHLARENPERRVSLVAFSNDVQVLGDGGKDPVIVTGDRLGSWDELGRLGEGVPASRPVRESKEDLFKRLWGLEEEGATALGPALRIAVAMAGSAPGSAVVLCTDGMANQGIGSLEAKTQEMTAFYGEIGEQALLKGVTVSVLTLTGTDCRLEQLSVVAEKTGGTVDRVDPRTLSKQLDAIVGSPTALAFGVMAMACLHKALRYSGEFDDEADQRFWLVRDLGSVSATSEATFSYAFRPKEEAGDLSGLTSIPFQVQLLYTRPDGATFLRVSTDTIAVTQDRAEAERQADAQVVGAHVAQRAARLAKQGRYEEAQLETRSAQRFLGRVGGNTMAEQFSSQVSELDDALRAEREQELTSGGAPQSERERQSNRGDAAAAVISKAAKANVFFK